MQNSPYYIIYIFLFFISVAPEVVSVTAPIVVANIGDDVNITCIIRGDPLSTTTWTKVEGPVSPTVGNNITTYFDNSTITYITNNLLISSAVKDDYGLYKCSASNSYGTASVDVWLYFNCE